MIGVRHDHGPGGQSQHVMSVGRDMVAGCNHMLEFRRPTDWLAFRYPQFALLQPLQEGLYQSVQRCCQRKHDALLEW